MKRVALILAIAIAATWAARVDVPRLTGKIKGDEATYVSMALSVAKDHDLKYRPEDYRRFLALYGTGPDGIFLKQTFRLQWRVRAAWPPIQINKSPVPTDVELDYGKPFAYALAAAPFVASVGLGGLLLFNILLLALSAWCAVAFCRARVGRVAGTFIGVTFIGASVVPVYLAWLTPELFNFTLVLVAYFLWLYKDVIPPDGPEWVRRPALDWMAAVLLGVATFSKPLYGPLIAPLVLTALARGRWRSGLVTSCLFGVTALGLFGANEQIAGDWNYQGGIHRSSFQSKFPFDERGTKFDLGNPMATNEANDEHLLSRQMLSLLPRNAVYFMLGRNAGLLPYFFPGVLIGLLWLVRLRRAAMWQVMTAAGCVGATLGLLVLAPALWNGGGGPVGNRYFLAIYPTLLFLLPAGTGLVATLVMALVGVTFIGRILVHPFEASQTVWLNSEHWPLRLLPIELTILNDLPVHLKYERFRIPVSKDPEVFLYYMDSHTYYAEKNGGFWVAPGTAEIVIRTVGPLSGLTLRLTSPIDNAVDIDIDGRSNHTSLKKGAESTVYLRPEPGVYAYSSHQIVLRLTTRSGFHPLDFGPSADSRYLGVFVKPSYEVK
jgi:hypothetical protein